MTTHTTTDREGARPSPLANERGMLLVITMVVLLVVSTLAAANLINAFLERSLAKNQNYASIALEAADAGLATGIAWLNDPANKDNLPGSSVNPGPPWADSDFDAPAAGSLDRSLASSGSFEVALTLMRDADDRDKDCDFGEIVLFNRPKATPSPANCDCDPATANPDCAGADDGKFGYENSFFANAGEGYPVIQIASRGRYRAAGYRNLTLEVAKNRYNIRANGAVTAMGNVNVTGTITVDGTSHDINGAPGGDCGSAFVGINVPADQDINGDGDYDDPGERFSVDPGGTSNLAGDPAGIGADSVVSLSPDEALGLCDADGDGVCSGTGAEVVNEGGPLDTMMDSVGGLPPAGTTRVWGNITYINNDFDIQNGTGVLIVHNPKFEPRKWHCSITRVPSAVAGPPLVDNPMLTKPVVANRPNECWDWNPTTMDYEHSGNYDAALHDGYDGTKFPHQQTANAYVAERRPRNMSGNGATTFKGAIIADQINPINGNLTVIGAMVSLSGISINVLGSGTASVLYSCDALNLFGALGYSTKLGWHRLY